ncbi:hypothetical protein NHX12_021401 [Muraenolepis orangiensis]|uniref:Uncharacterized protein n=1 Tax=Muraenolepis orangiensis TaxID=630683 RepID=A0A9Q0EQ11_9TELE|nr:hypothetical protein NHX12_021401 [Muraenolepis orangiensis]
MVWQGAGRMLQGGVGSQSVSRHVVKCVLMNEKLNPFTGLVEIMKQDAGSAGLWTRRTLDQQDSGPAGLWTRRTLDQQDSGPDGLWTS